MKRERSLWNRFLLTSTITFVVIMWAYIIIPHLN